jgi:hypothetical protein
VSAIEGDVKSTDDFIGEQKEVLRIIGTGAHIQSQLRRVET